MKFIRDIRLYKSVMDSSHKVNPSPFASKKLDIITTRIVMKLRENDFCLSDEYDHLYMNYTPALPENEVKIGKRLDLKEFSFFQYFDAGVSEEAYENLEQEKYYPMILDLLKKTLIQFFSEEESTQKIIEASFEAALSEGENMLMRFKEKKTAKKHAIIYLRCLDNGHFYPLLRVYDKADNIILEKDLPQAIHTDCCGQILLNDKRIEIRPKKNVFARDLEPIVFEFE